MAAWVVRSIVSSKPDRAVEEFDEGRVEDGLHHAVLVDLQFGEEGLVQAPSPTVVGFGVQPVAVSEETQGSIQAFFDEPRVDLRDVQQPLGLRDLGVECNLTLLEVREADGAVQVSVDQLLPPLLEALQPPGLARDELANGSLMLGDLLLYRLAGERDQLGIDAQGAPVLTNIVLDLGHAQMRQIAGGTFGVASETEEVGIQSTALSAGNPEPESRSAASTEEASLQEVVVSPGAIARRPSA